MEVTRFYYPDKWGWRKFGDPHESKRQLEAERAEEARMQTEVQDQQRREMGE
jgi:hypothetical protein